MSFISPSDHEKLIKLFQSSIEHTDNGDEVSIADEQAESLRADISQLELIAEQYKRTIAHLQELGRQYKIILQRTKVNMRKQQIRKNRGRSKGTVFRRR